ncbi:hypothetical protein EB796_020458 [Bugula neritina]|uniref:Uncharacterized protein n=1 Tax=Bugula neritina TaxID=10212 RepID=A0A7J7J4W8_BUGNE|nr:hypothetical protein EB796_020458 [Bugula neritina]
MLCRSLAKPKSAVFTMFLWLTLKINRHQKNKTWWQRNLMVNLKDGRHFTTWTIEFKGRRFVRRMVALD